MKHAPYLILIAAILALNTNHTQAEQDMVFIEYQTDICAADDMGLKRLTYEDVYKLLEE